MITGELTPDNGKIEWAKRILLDRRTYKSFGCY